MLEFCNSERPWRRIRLLHGEDEQEGARTLCKFRGIAAPGSALIRSVETPLTTEALAEANDDGMWGCHPRPLYG